MGQQITHADTIAKAKAGCERSKAELIKHYEKLIVKLAVRHGSKLEREDACQLGTIGLLEALEPFDLDAGYQFATFARHRIAERIRTAQRAAPLVKITGRTNPALQGSRICKARQKLEARGQIPTPAAVAKLAGIKLEDIDDEVRRSLTASNSAYTAIEDAFQLADNLPPPDAHIDRQKGVALIHKAAATLNDREKRILFARVAANDEPATLADLSAEFGVSRERIRQIEVGLLKKLSRQFQIMGVANVDLEPPKKYTRKAA
ncbi:MAG: hypothetical protein CL949_11240 [Erythrobacter sp.]|nr:hypothetical protein [Erythrobacter sp.]